MILQPFNIICVNNVNVVVFSPTILFLVVAAVTRNVQGNNKIKEMVENAGCPFVSRKQLLVRNVCILPDYQQTELPEFAAEGGVTKVDIYLHEAKVLEIDERKEKESREGETEEEPMVNWVK